MLFSFSLSFAVLSFSHIIFIFFSFFLISFYIYDTQFLLAPLSSLTFKLSLFTLSPVSIFLSSFLSQYSSPSSFILVFYLHLRPFSPFFFLSLSILQSFFLLSFAKHFSFYLLLLLFRFSFFILQSLQQESGIYRRCLR